MSWTSNSKVNRRKIVIAAVACLALLATGQPLAAKAPAEEGETQAQSQTGNNHRLSQLVGAWRVQAKVVKQNATFPALITFTGDGIVLADEPPSPFETTAHGSWVATGSRTANYTFIALIGSQEGPLSAEIKVVGTLQLDAKAEIWSGPFHILVVDAVGKEILSDTGTFEARRIAVEPLSASAVNRATAMHVAEN